MKYWQGLIFYVVAFILQPFLYNLMPGIGVTPNLILCLTVVFTFIYEEPIIGIGYGLVFALLSDLFFGQYIGPAAVSIVIVGTMIFFLKGFANIENIINIIIMTVISSWLYGSVYWIIYSFIGAPYGYMMVIKFLPWQLLFNCIIVAMLYLVLIRGVIKHRRDRYFR